MHGHPKALPRGAGNPMRPVITPCLTGDHSAGEGVWSGGHPRPRPWPGVSVPLTTGSNER